ncbi:MAG TPA: DUF5666 domain-containing protein, partial [Solirubrobacter sp.]
MRILAFLCVAAALACNQGSAPRATVQGQVLAADGRPAAGLQAGLAGTALLTQTDSAGQFSLNGAPTGPATLQVAGSTLGLPPLADGMVARVSVRLAADGAARLDGAPQAMLRGKVASITGRDFHVGGTMIRTDDNTQIRANGMGAGVDDRIVGEAADVDGSLQQDGSVLARRINTALKGSSNSIFQFYGTIESITPPNQLVVAGRPVFANSSTKIEIAERDAYFSALSVGQKVEVKGLLQADQSVLASEIEAQAAVAPPPAPRPVANAGPAQSVTSGALVTLDGSASTDPSGLALSF